jgi:hypothetical protein
VFAFGEFIFPAFFVAWFFNMFASWLQLGFFVCGMYATQVAIGHASFNQVAIDH